MYIVDEFSLWSFQWYKIYEDIPAWNDLNHGRNWENSNILLKARAEALSVFHMPVFHIHCRTMCHSLFISSELMSVGYILLLVIYFFQHTHIV